MSTLHRMLPLGLMAATMLAACSDLPSSPTHSLAAGSAVAAKGAGGGTGGGGGGAKGGGTQLLITTPPTVNTTGTWIGTVIGPVPAGAVRSVTVSIAQSVAGFVSGTVANRTIDGTLESVVGTVNGDTLALYIGNVCGACTLSPIYNGNMSPDGTQLIGSLFVLSATPFVATKQ